MSFDQGQDKLLGADQSVQSVLGGLRKESRGSDSK